MKWAPKTQYFLAVTVVIVSAIGCYAFTDILGYHAVALLLLMLTSLLAMVLDVVPVVIAATLSALIWNFFFIPPRFTFHITYSEDLLLFLLYFFIALLNGILTVKIRQAEAKARDKEEKVATIVLYNTLLNSLSHELRTPISTIIGSVDTLKDQDVQLQSAQKEELFQTIQTASLRLNQQVENLLNMSRLESGVLQLSLDWLDVEEWINGLLNRLRVEEQETGISFELQEGIPLFKLDRGIMDQIIGNLLTNSMQYAGDNARIHVGIKFIDDQLELQISDNGPGFPPECIPFVFDKFYRLPQSKTGGTGLGLSIVKGYVEAHHGTITLVNAAHEGCLFTIRIPAETSYVNLLKHD
jgi:two-component system sensor histidine kinase KdpD